MKISCPACAAKYSIADEKVQDKLAKIRCRKCGTTIVIDGKVSPPNVFAGEASQVESPAVSDPGHAASADAGGGAGEYSVDFGDNDQRSMTLADLVAAYNRGEVTGDTFIWADGMDDWQPLGQVAAVVDALNAGSAPAPAPAPAPVAAPQAFQPPAAPAVAAPPWEPKHVESPSAMRAAAKLGGGRGSTSDLFGAYETAGSEADVTTSAREPSIGLGGASAPAAGGATGARNESSVLFSLSALTASAPAKPAASAGSASSSISFAGGSTATKEDSGLIDLKALTAASEPQAAAPILAPAPLGMAPPLGLAPPMGGVEAQYPAAQQKSSKTGLFIGAGIAVAAVAIAIAIVVTSNKPPPPAPPAPVATQPTPAPTPTPETTQASTAKAPATGTSEEKPPEEKTTKKVATGGRPIGGPIKKSGGETTTKPTETKKPAGPAKNPCGCASGDLQCAMKCAAGGG